MAKKPKILKKVEKLSRRIAEFMDGYDSTIHTANAMLPSLVDNDQVLFWPDFLVDPEPGHCVCYYGGEKLHCKETHTQLEDSGCQFKDLPENVFPGCIVRKYADIYKSAMKFLED